MCVCACVYVSVREIWSERERMCVCQRERESVCACVRKRERETACVYV